jgi:hypothetical protein
MLPSKRPRISVAHSAFEDTFEKTAADAVQSNTAVLDSFHSHLSQLSHLTISTNRLILG